VVILSEAKDLGPRPVRSFASLRMTGPVVIVKIHNRHVPAPTMIRRSMIRIMVGATLAVALHGVSPRAGASPAPTRYDRSSRGDRKGRPATSPHCGPPTSYIQHTPSVPAGMPWQTSDFVTKPSAITVVAMFDLSTATGVSRMDGIAVPSEVFTVTPFVNEEDPVPATSAFTRSAVPWASLAIAL